MEDRLQYAKPIEEATKLFEDLLPKDKWSLDRDREGFQIYTRIDPISDFMIARGDIVINKAASVIIKVLEDPVIALKWDTETAEYEILESTDGYYICRNLTKKQPLFTQRECLLVTMSITKPDRSLFVIGKSIDHPSYPPREEYVRAEVPLYGWLLTPDKEDPNKTHVVYMILVDPKGSMPASMFNIFAPMSAESARRIKEYVEKLE